jgi:molybdopterin synthase catalytic subunit
VAALWRITEDPIRPEELTRAVQGPDRGALATFAGVVRDHHAGRAVLRLEYHAYLAMAERVLGEIAEETSRRFGTPHVAIVHRIGRLEIGETSVLIAVAAAHRREALAACAFAIDRVKERAPIWKKEYYRDGAVWIEGPESGGACGADR